MSVHAHVLHPATTFPRRMPARRLSLVLPAATPAPPDEVALVVSRFQTGAEQGTCALCWTGPGPMAGSLRQRGALGHDAIRTVCQRCLVGLELLAAQFAPDLRLSIETPT